MEGSRSSAGAAPSAPPDALSPTAVCQYWKEFDLESLRGALDEQGLAVAGRQEASVAQRKQLADRTKDFRRGLAPDLFKQVSPLLRMYQEEVDRLTTRAKAGEAAFLDVFSRLYEAPDPAPAIATGLELGSRAAEAEAAAARAARELADFKAEAKELKNQDLTIRRLEERVRLLEAEVSERGAEVEEAHRAAAAQLEARDAEESRAREARLADELERAQAGMEALRRMHQATQAQLFSVQEQGQEAAAAAQAEAEFATAEVERAQRQLAELERERNALLQRVRQGGGGGDDASGRGDVVSSAGSVAAAEVAALREELRAQRDLASRLQAEASGAVGRGAAAAAAAASRLEALQEALQAKEAHCAALEAELAGRPTQSELQEARQQVRMLRAVVHNSLDDDEADGGGDGGRENGGVDGGAGPLEAALLGKNRHLEHTLTMARLEVAEARGEAEAASARASELEMDLEAARALIARLEEDLTAAERTHAAAAGAAAGAGGDEAGEGQGAAPGGSTAGEQTMVGVLAAQRDRLKARLAEAEAQAAAAAKALAKARADAEAAKADNVALVERLRFVQGYTGGARPAAVDLEAGGGGVLGKYSTDYEETVDPFNDFRAKEREARRRRMPLQDRAAFAVGSALVSGNRVARSAIVVYALALHFVAFLVLAGFSRHQEGKIERLEELCAKVHPLAGGGPGSLAVGGEQGAEVDPVMGGAVAAAGAAGRALLQRWLG